MNNSSKTKTPNLETKLAMKEAQILSSTKKGAKNVLNSGVSQSGSKVVDAFRGFVDLVLGVREIDPTKLSLAERRQLAAMYPGKIPEEFLGTDGIVVPRKKKAEKLPFWKRYRSFGDLPYGVRRGLALLLLAAIGFSLPYALRWLLFTTMGV